MKIYQKLLLTIISASLLVSSFYGQGFLCWISLVLYFTVIYFCSNIKQCLVFGFLFGFIFYCGVTYWFTYYTFGLWIPIVGYLVIFVLVSSVAIYFIYKKVSWPFLRIVLITSVWLAIEFFRHRTFMAFPWGVLGYSQYSYLPIMQIAKVTGIYGVSFILIFANASLAEIAIGMRKVRKIKYKHLLAPLALVIIVLISGNLSMYIYSQKDVDKNSINIALVQPNITFDNKFQEDSRVLIPQPYSNKSYFKPGTDLVVFPESALWGSIEREKNKSFANWAKDVLKEENLYLLVGQILWDKQKNYYNSVLLYSPNLKILGRYNKIHPLPFAEYMPYPNILGFLKFLNIAKLNITPDREVTLINYPEKGQIGSNICFESTLPVISRTFREKCADIVFVLTDDAGFRDSLASWHHVIFSTVRAVENSSYVVHSSNLGVSAVIDPVGRIMLKTRLGAKGVFYSKAAFIGEKSIYSRIGNLFLYLYFTFSIIYLVYYLCTKKR